MIKDVKAIVFDYNGVLSTGKRNVFFKKDNAPSRGIHEYVAKKLKISVDKWFDSIDTQYAESI